MDLESVDADGFGRSLTGVGLNLLVSDVRRHVELLEALFDTASHQVSDDFAILVYSGQILQLHADATYHSNPLLGVVRAVDARGPGVEIRFYDTDPDVAVERAAALGLEVLQPPTDKPHGLREAYIVCHDGFVWVPSRPSSGEPPGG